MSETKPSRGVVVKHPDGLHIRLGERFVSLAGQFESTVEVIKGAERVDASSIMEVLSLGAVQGTELEIEASGPDADAVLDALVEFFEQVSIDEDTTSQQEANDDVA
ncbi:MAG: HPr family phosphocarrier protein [Pirellulales bacterium]